MTAAARLNVDRGVAPANPSPIKFLARKEMIAAPQQAKIS
jgi:hypothetical protein